MTKLLLAIWLSFPALIWAAATEQLLFLEGTKIGMALDIYMVFVGPYLFIGATGLLAIRYGLLPIINWFWKAL